MDMKIFNLNKKDLLYLFIVLIFSLGLIYFRTIYHMSGGMYYPDKALYLMNALMYSGLDYNAIVNPQDIFFSPIISFLTSLLFRIGIVDQLAISLVSSFFAIFGFIGLYFLLRCRFNSLLSLTGVILYGSMSQFLINLSSGLLDVPSISISILILLFGIMAVDVDSKYFIISFILLVIGFFTRYTVGFMLPLLLLYYIMKRNFIENFDEIINDTSLIKSKLKNYLTSNEFKYIILSIAISLILFILICKYLILDFGSSLSFIAQSSNTIKNTNYGVGGGIDVVYDKLFYLKNFSNILFNESRFLDRVYNFLIICIIGFGLLFRLDNIIKNFNQITDNIEEWKSGNFKKFLKLLFSSLIIIGLLSFKILSSHFIFNICFLISITIFYSLITKLNINKDEQALNLLFISYFVIYFMFFSIYPTKTFRYSLPLLPSLIYIIIYYLEGILDNLNQNNIVLNFNEKEYNGYKKFIPILFIFALLISSFSFIAFEEISGAPDDLVDITEYIINNDQDYHQKTFASNFRDSRLLRWYLNDNVTVDDDYTQLDYSNSSYIISNSSLTLKNYHKIYNNKNYYLYYIN